MVKIFVNLKRFDIPETMGGICRVSDPRTWIETIIEQTIELGLGKKNNVNLTYLIPDELILTAISKIRSFPKTEIKNLSIGNQSVHRHDVSLNINFGAFTSHTPASAAANIGCAWTIIGHSEERRDKFEILADYDHEIEYQEAKSKKANEVIGRLLNSQVLCALKRDINILFCIGETAEERGSGNLEEQKPRIEEVLSSQIENGLCGTRDYLQRNKIVLGYEPRWAIGPGKTPPSADYISYISKFVKDTVKDQFRCDVPVVYGGGLKEENALIIGGITSIDGGLVALTKFVQPLAFETEGLRKIIDSYLSAQQDEENKK